MTGTVEDESSEPKGNQTRVRVLQAIDKVLKKTLDCSNSSVVAQLCYSISQELAGNSSSNFCDLMSDASTCTLAKCELCVNTAISSRMARSGLAENDVAEESCYIAMLRGKCNVPNCTMPCFTLYKDLVLNIIDGLAYHRIIRDENGTAVDLEFTDVNPAFERITGIKREVAAGRRITEFLPGVKDDPFDWIGFYDKVAQSGESVTIEQYSHALSRWYQIHLTPKDQDHLTAIFFDVTKLKETEQELRSLNQELELRVEEKVRELKIINDELESFVYSVSHDLRAPLRAVDGFSSALLDTYFNKLDKEGQHYLERMRSGAKGMGILIDDLLNLSRIAQSPLIFQEVNLSAIVLEIIKDLRESEPKKCVDIIMTEDLEAFADRGLIRIALTNLIANAWKFTRMKKTAIIEVSCKFDAKEQIFFVKDNGIGFDMQYADRLFAPFQRFHPTSEFEGSGIGLSTVQRIIHRHGGRIWAESSPGQGSTFFFTLRAGVR